MKILIVSDTHKSHKNLKKVLEGIGSIDMLIHLGDVEGEEDYIAALASCPMHILSGNNDFFSTLPGEKEFSLAGHHIFITHGHHYYVNRGEEHLRAEARKRGADIVMYGHTHRPSLTEEQGLTILSPGSIAYPRQSGRQASYMIMEIDAAGQTHFELKYV